MEHREGKRGSKMKGNERLNTHYNTRESKRGGRVPSRGLETLDELLDLPLLDILQNLLVGLHWKRRLFASEHKSAQKEEAGG
jgi:hypothetical protein